jgi:hypothetical protein
MDYNKSKDLSDRLRQIAIEFNISIVTATQIPRSENDIGILTRVKPQLHLTLIDHINIIDK